MPSGNGGWKTKSCLGECDLVTGMAVSWSSIYPERQDPQVIKAEIAAARNWEPKDSSCFIAITCTMNT